MIVWQGQSKARVTYLSAMLGRHERRRSRRRGCSGRQPSRTRRRARSARPSRHGTPGHVPQQVWPASRSQSVVLASLPFEHRIVGELLRRWCSNVNSCASAMELPGCGLTKPRRARTRAREVSACQARRLLGPRRERSPTRGAPRGLRRVARSRRACKTPTSVDGTCWMSSRSGTAIQTSRSVGTSTPSSRSIFTISSMKNGLPSPRSMMLCGSGAKGRRASAARHLPGRLLASGRAEEIDAFVGRGVVDPGRAAFEQQRRVVPTIIMERSGWVRAR